MKPVKREMLTHLKQPDDDIFSVYCFNSNTHVSRALWISNFSNYIYDYATNDVLIDLMIKDELEDRKK